MAKSLESLTEISSGGIHPALTQFLDSIPRSKRKEELTQDLQRVFSGYNDSLKRNIPPVRRATILEQSYGFVPSEQESQNKNPKAMLNQRLYSNPGRQYSYVNGIVGDKKKPNEIKKELGKALGYTVTSGLPIIGAGIGWNLANNWYKTQSAKSLTDKLGDSFDKPWWKYLWFGGTKEALKDTGELLAKAGLQALWGAAKTPLLYAIGAYAAYKTIGYFIKRRKEKKLEREEVEKLERMRNDFLLQSRRVNA
ncbi:MAG TPA: hypothetical protein PLK34_02245 [Candidatus Pacearchaeota archaeon]|nr:hypothetical protein [Candidatus Pacearchaeota archaeon]